MRYAAVMLGVFLGVMSGCAASEEVSFPPAQPTSERDVNARSTSTALTHRPAVGGQLLLSRDGKRLVMLDPAADRLRVYAAPGLTIESTLPLGANSWPTRAVETAGGAFVVLLRGTGEVASFKRGPAGWEVTRKALCPEPRALAVDETTAQLWAGCAGGELIHLDDALEPISVKRTDVEWRDLSVAAGQVEGISFRAAELISTADERPVARRALPARGFTPEAATHQPQVAWRLLASGARRIVVHQLHAEALQLDSAPSPDAGLPPGAQQSGYGIGSGSLFTPCPSSAAVVTGVTVLEGGTLRAALTTADVLPVDAALSPDGLALAIAGAGGTGLRIYGIPSGASPGACMRPTQTLTGRAVTSVTWLTPTRLAFTELLQGAPMGFDLTTGRVTPASGDEPQRVSEPVSLFHLAPLGGAPVACASCHPEGGEDGHTWILDGKPRRTQTLAGGVMSRGPFHWTGDLGDLDALMGDTFVKRMGGLRPNAATVTTLGAWLDTIPAPRPSRQLSGAQREAGLAAFQKAQCGGCHLKNGLAEGGVSDIGTGEAVRAPSLGGLQARAPYLHTGEVPDIRARVLGGKHPSHGRLGALSELEQEDLIAYLESL